MAHSSTQQEGLALTRLLLVLSSFAPLFLLWAVKGTSLIADIYFLPFCCILAGGPTAILWCRIHIARKRRDQHELLLGPPEDKSSYLIGYLFAILLPFYRQDVETWRDFAALWIALAFIVLLFWSLKLHHLNILFLTRGYRIYSIGPRNEDDHLGKGGDWTLLTRRETVREGLPVTALRITDALYLDLHK